MRRKDLYWDQRTYTERQSEITDFVIVDDEVYPVDKIPPELEDEQPEVLNEDYLYEALRDGKLEQLKCRN